MALANAKRRGLRWPATAFLQDVPPSTFFRKQNRDMIYGNALNELRSLKGETGAMPVSRRRFNGLSARGAFWYAEPHLN
jgi:hypothetical protein